MNKQTVSLVRQIVESPHSAGRGVYEQELLKFLDKQYGPLPFALKIVITFASLFLKSGHICLPLDKSAVEWAEILEAEWPDQERPPAIDPEELLDTPLVGHPEELSLFVIDGSRFYFRKQWKMERNLALRIRERIQSRHEQHDIQIAQKALEKLFPAGNNSYDSLKLASALSLNEKLLIITGGPGTGKTSAVCKILALHDAVSNKPLRVALAAPTGKAAARLTESVQSSFDSGFLPDPTDSRHTLKGMTLHRMLSGWDENGLLPSFNPTSLPYDLIIVDEASMIDLSMMNRLLTNSGKDTSIVLLGDSDQLSSVQAGAVFSELCELPAAHLHRDSIRFLESIGCRQSPLLTEIPGSTLPIIRFEKNFRAAESSALMKFINAVREEDTNAIYGLTDNPLIRDVTLAPFSYDGEQFQAMVQRLIHITEQCRNLQPEGIFSLWRREAILSPLRNGPHGTVEINRRIESAIHKKRQIPTADGWYTGRPVIITQNDYNLDIFNGDQGVCYLDENRTPWVCLQHHSKQFVRYPASRIKNYDPAFVITVHKSQGSEYDNVTLLLPEELSPVLTKDLIYTAVTRARTGCAIRGEKSVFEHSLRRKNAHFSSLREKIFKSG